MFRRSQSIAYISLVMEYASIVWDPYQITYINNLERIQRRPARWATSNYSRFSSVSNILQYLAWPTLDLHRKIARLSFFHKIINNLAKSSSPPLLLGMGQYSILS